MNIPLFPEFKEVDLLMKNDIDQYLTQSPLEASEYTFTNIFAYKKAYNFKVSVMNESLVILKDTPPASFFCPVGAPLNIKSLFDLLGERGEDPCLERVPESFVKRHITHNKNYEAIEEREHFDYLHDVKELIELKGRKFHDKKNKVNKFRSAYKYEYHKLTNEIIEECLEYEHYWCEERDCEKDHGLRKERCAILAMLKNFDALNLSGGVIRIDGRIAALTITEEFLSDTVVIHIEKANPDIPGLYQVINQEFLMHEGEKYTFVNREQDLGIKGLRNAKMSYNPVRFIKKYIVRPAVIFK